MSMISRGVVVGVGMAIAVFVGVGMRHGEGRRMSRTEQVGLQRGMDLIESYLSE